MSGGAARPAPVKVALIAAALAAGLVPAPARADPVDATRLLAAIPGEIMFVRIAGTWASPEREGLTRIVLIRPSVRAEAMRLFVQWLAPDSRGSRFAVVAAEEVPEVFDWRLKIDDYRIEPETTGSRVLFEATVLTNGQRRRYELTIGPPGDVMFAAR
ncbi:hypothetical protein BN1110_03469 [bacterium YEK0313]|nr:hypothetical protein BN1110_03469 [bacterium YEK0313]